MRFRDFVSTAHVDNRGEGVTRVSDCQSSTIVDIDLLVAPCECPRFVVSLRMKGT